MENRDKKNQACEKYKEDKARINHKLNPHMASGRNQTWATFGSAGSSRYGYYNILKVATSRKYCPNMAAYESWR